MRENKYTKLVIIGNGFDLWQGLDTSFSSFQKYYLDNRKKIVKSIKAPLYEVEDEGEKITISDVELVYGDVFDPYEMDDEFWYDFESSLAVVDSEQINLYFGKGKKDLKRMRKSINNANKILSIAFSNWINSIEKKGATINYHFPKDAFFINFNYTDTLQRLFSIESERVYHIHGNREDNIFIFGHNLHPQTPEPTLIDFGGRFEGLYVIDELLYKTDKHVRENFSTFLVNFYLSGGKIEDIKEIYVLGHSFGDVDLDYFKALQSMFMGDASKIKKKRINIEEVDEIGQIMLRIDYLTKTIGSFYRFDEPTRESIQAMDRKLQYEHQCFDDELERTVLKLLKLKSKEYKGLLRNNIYKSTNKKNIKWHITCYEDEERNELEEKIKSIKISNYKVHKTIEECLLAMDSH